MELSINLQKLQVGHCWSTLNTLRITTLEPKAPVAFRRYARNSFPTISYATSYKQYFLEKRMVVAVRQTNKQ